MAPKPIVHLLIACGVFVVTTSINQNQGFSNQLFGNQLNRDQQLSAKRGASASCPEKNGRFPVQNQCDAYIECIDGVPEEKLCPEGLVFNPEARFNYPCGYPIDVDCTGRPNLQPADPSVDCPHQYGYFKIGDHQHCGQFMNCVDGRGYVFDCPEGLAFNPETYRCDWPDQVPDCDAEAFLGFRCPEVKSNSFFLAGETKFYRSNADCHHFFLCVNGRPRLQNCGEGNAFNELIDACDAAENVTGCEHEAKVRTSELNIDSRLQL
ncbi:protein obstructor-E [Harpegnathos saltator]|uniref:protein obstructor-E n=1 Tax=Harpegnathos saltator TaxID=610380 RepID=UPI00058F83FF|nr:protein obstructor-E [Harpegnathos saltator]